MSDTLTTGRKGALAFQATVCALKHRDVLQGACVACPCQAPEANWNKLDDHRLPKPRDKKKTVVLESSLFL